MTCRHMRRVLAQKGAPLCVGQGPGKMAAILKCLVCSMLAIGTMTFVDDVVDEYAYNKTYTLYALVTHFSGWVAKVS